VTDKTDEKDKGLSYVPQIKAVYEELIASHKSSLTHALHLGELLNGAKQAVGHGAWGQWLQFHLPQISHRTANVYMKLAENKDKFSDGANSQRAAKLATKDDLSIRAAIDAVNKADGGGLKPVPMTDPKPQAKPKPKPDLETALADVAPDEVLTGIKHKWGAEGPRRLLEEQLKTASPYDLAMTLQNVWKLDNVRTLISELTHLLTKPETKPDLNIPKALDRRPEARP
jgi:hypothetical protein